MLGAQKIKLTTLAFPVTQIYKALVMTEEHTAKKKQCFDGSAFRKKKKKQFLTQVPQDWLLTYIGYCNAKILF